MAIVISNSQLTALRDAPLSMLTFREYVPKEIKRADFKRSFQTLALAKRILAGAEQNLALASAAHTSACKHVKDRFVATENSALSNQEACQNGVQVAVDQLLVAAGNVYSAQDAVAQLALGRNNWVFGPGQDYKACALDLYIAKQGGNLIEEYQRYQRMGAQAIQKRDLEAQAALNTL